MQTNQEKKNSFKLKFVSQDECKIEATCDQQGNFVLNRDINSGMTNTINRLSIVNTINNSGSLNFSKTASNLSFHTVRISKNSVGGDLILGSSINFNFCPEDSVEISDYSEKPDDLKSSTASVIYVKKTNEKNSSILYTPSTICNYYQRSNEVTPNKTSFKLNLKNLSNCTSSEENENAGSSSRQKPEKKTPIKYTKSQLRSGEKILMKQLEHHLLFQTFLKSTPKMLMVLFQL
jgi:hypothetical protein